jgi:hypothetical protein
MIGTDIRTTWKRAWGLYRCHQFNARTIGPFHWAAAKCWRDREHMNEMPPVINYYHRRALGQSAARALEGARRRIGGRYSHEGWSR